MGAKAEPPATPSAADIAAYERSITWKHWFEGLPDPHSAPRFLDGARGFLQGKPIAMRVVPVFPARITSFTDYKYWSAGCSRALIVTATSIDSSSFLAYRKQSILTQFRFRIDDVIRAPAGIGVGAIVSVVRVGGDVVDDGERLRVVSDGDGSPYLPGQRYLLLARSSNELEMSRFVSSSPTIQVTVPIAYVETGVDKQDVWTFVFE